MKAFLMYRDRDFDLRQKPPWNEKALTKDLELNTLFDAMAGGDDLVREVAQRALIASETDLEVILYRQDVLKDCLKHESIAREIYSVATEGVEREKKTYKSFLTNYPSAVLDRSMEVLQMFVGMLRELRLVAEEHSSEFESEGFKAFFEMLKRELGEDYFEIVHRHLKRMKFRSGVLVSAGLGKGQKAVDYTLRKPLQRNEGWLDLLLEERPETYTFHLHPRDENGARDLADLRDQGINLVANALAQSTDHILSFFQMLRTELAFYIGCLNLYLRLTSKGESLCFPQASASQERKHSFTGLYDVCLALSLEQKVISNNLQADGKDLVFITGANQGGKSTFLRSQGLSQLMMQCGMFVPAESFEVNVCDGLFTHYKREEDAAMKSGKFDEELVRMNEIVDAISPNSFLLLNESFAATNEREGSEIARELVRALLERRIKIFFVTHFYELADGFYEESLANAVFLRAERQEDGLRTFKLIEGRPLETSYGEDLYNRIFVSQPSEQQRSEDLTAT
jgi:DNA mismatch repair ATPase MutS